MNGPKRVIDIEETKMKMTNMRKSEPWHGTEEVGERSLTGPGRGKAAAEQENRRRERWRDDRARTTSQRNDFG